MSEQKGHRKALLRLPEVEARTGMRKTSIYLGMKAGTFPRCVKLGQRTVAWPEERIDAFVDAKVAAGAASAQPKPAGAGADIGRTVDVGSP